MVRRNRLDSLIRSRTLIRLMSIPKRKGKQRRKKFEHDKPAHNLSMFAIFETSSCLARAFFDEWKTVICTVRKAISPNESSWVEEAMPSSPSVVGDAIVNVEIREESSSHTTKPAPSKRELSSRRVFPDVSFERAESFPSSKDSRNGLIRCYCERANRT